MQNPASHFAECANPTAFPSVDDPDRAQLDGGRDRPLAEDQHLLADLLDRLETTASTREIARALLARFGCFGAVLAGPEHQLLSVRGMTPQMVSALKLTERAGHRMAKSRIERGSVLSSWSDLLRYVTTRMAHLRDEQFRVLFLNTKNTLIADEVLQSGTVNFVPVLPRKIIQRALDLNATALILLHNHPSGDTTPSEHDIQATRTLAATADALDITVHDHLIIGAGTPYSFKDNRLI